MSGGVVGGVVVGCSGGNSGGAFRGAEVFGVGGMRSDSC